MGANRGADIQHRVESLADERMHQIAHRIEGVGQAFRKTGQQLKSEDQPELSNYVEAIGDRVERVARYLEGHDARDVVDELERFARRQPAAFLGGAFAVGFLTVRFLKSSGRRDHGSDEQVEHAI